MGIYTSSKSLKSEKSEISDGGWTVDQEVVEDGESGGGGDDDDDGDSGSGDADGVRSGSGGEGECWRGGAVPVEEAPCVVEMFRRCIPVSSLGESAVVVDEV